MCVRAEGSERVALRPQGLEVLKRKRERGRERRRDSTGRGKCAQGQEGVRTEEARGPPEPVVCGPLL